MGRRTFGFEQLRQEKAIRAAAVGRDALAVLPTDAGKSGHLPAGELLLLRAHFPLSGSHVVAQLGWHQGGAAAAIDEEAHLKAQDVAHDQSHGPTGWETGFDR